MGLNIKNAEVEQLATEVTRMAGETRRTRGVIYAGDDFAQTDLA